MQIGRDIKPYTELQRLKPNAIWQRKTNRGDFSLCITNIVVRIAQWKFLGTTLYT